MTETTVETTQVTEEVKNPEAVLAELRRAQEDLKNLRAEYNKLTQERDDFKKQVEDDVWKTKALLAETKNALAKQGIKDADRLMPYIGTDGLELSEDGKVNGLDERLKQLRADLPEVFDPKRRAGGRADIFADSSAEPKQDPLRAAVHNAIHGE